MKKLLLSVLVLLVGCRKIDFPAPINLGVQSQSTAITKVHPIVSNGQITVDMNVTGGAKYSLQVTEKCETALNNFFNEFYKLSGATPSPIASAPTGTLKP